MGSILRLLSVLDCLARTFDQTGLICEIKSSEGNLAKQHLALHAEGYSEPKESARLRAACANVEFELVEHDHTKIA